MPAESSAGTVTAEAGGPAADLMGVSSASQSERLPSFDASLEALYEQFLGPAAATNDKDTIAKAVRLCTSKTQAMREAWAQWAYHRGGGQLDPRVTTLARLLNFVDVCRLGKSGFDAMDAELPEGTQPPTLHRVFTKIDTEHVSMLGENEVRTAFFEAGLPEPVDVAFLRSKDDSRNGGCAVEFATEEQLHAALRASKELKVVIRGKPQEFVRAHDLLQGKGRSTFGKGWGKGKGKGKGWGKGKQWDDWGGYAGDGGGGWDSWGAGVYGGFGGFGFDGRGGSADKGKGKGFGGKPGFDPLMFMMPPAMPTMPMGAPTGPMGPPGPMTMAPGPMSGPGMGLGGMGMPDLSGLNSWTFPGKGATPY